MSEKKTEKPSKLLPYRETRSVFDGAPVQPMDGKTAKRERWKTRVLTLLGNANIPDSELEYLWNSGITVYRAVERIKAIMPVSRNVSQLAGNKTQRQSKDPREYRPDALD